MQFFFSADVSARDAIQTERAGVGIVVHDVKLVTSLGQTHVYRSLSFFDLGAVICVLALALHTVDMM